MYLCLNGVKGIQWSNILVDGFLAMVYLPPIELLLGKLVTINRL